MACLAKRARDVELGMASMDTFTPIVLELSSRECCLGVCLVSSTSCRFPMLLFVPHTGRYPPPQPFGS